MPASDYATANTSRKKTCLMQNNVINFLHSRRSVVAKKMLPIEPSQSDLDDELESTRMQRAGVVIAVLCTPVIPHKIPVWEQQLSSAAVCTHLVIAAQSLDYAAQWLTEWPAYNKMVIADLGGDPASDQIAGFIHIGKKQETPAERKRPVRTEKVSYWSSQ